MKKKLLFLILFIPFLTFSNDILFKRLDNLYQRDKSKCLEVTKRYIKYFPDQAAPYYFAVLSYKDKSLKARNARGEYISMRKAIGYAVQFELKDTEQLSEKVNWSTVKSDLESQAIILVEVLIAENETQLSQRLIVRLEEFSSNIDLAYYNSSTDKMDEAEIVELNNTTNFFFGMPSGNEVVTSANRVNELKLLDLINAEREKQGMESLEWDEDLARACRYHAYDLATQNYFNHSSYDRKNGKLIKVGGTFDRIRSFYDKSFVNSENIAAGNESAKATYTQWFNSKGHYENMFNPDSKKVGLGVVYDESSPFGYYWAFCTAL
jgi:uncharacterized protein YkwD